MASLGTSGFQRFCEKIKEFFITKDEVKNLFITKDEIKNLTNGTLLSNGTDLNTLFTPGWYYGLGSTTSYSNCPITGRNFVLCVFPSAEGSSTGERVAQMFITTGGTYTASSTYPSEVYVRGVRRTGTSSSNYSYTTTDWTTLASKADIPRYEIVTGTVDNSTSSSYNVTFSDDFSDIRYVEIYAPDGTLGMSAKVTPSTSSTTYQYTEINASAGYISSVTASSISVYNANGSNRRGNWTYIAYKY